ncbi:MAG: hypothetical protein EAX81_02925 [Candidatus Thorarchaeota archaeon]|nr:hypothetical protein [Candidatus Thorarchaeota archaeon]
MAIIDPIEGFFIVTNEGLIFEVKGNVQPKDRIIAYLRYIPDEKGNRISNNGMKYRKVYEFAEREEFLRQYYPQYLWNSEIHGRVIQAVPVDSIAFVLNPVDSMRQMRNMKHQMSQSQNAARELAEILVETADIDWSSIGITGSHLVGLETSASDIDLVVYGSFSARKLYSRLHTGHTIPSIMKYRGEQLEKHLRFRWARLPKWMTKLRKIESEKCLQGLFSSYEFYIRAVKLPNEMDWSFYDLFFESKGEHVVEGRVLSDLDSIFTPCVYSIECVEFADLQYLVSYRGRFAEHVKKGMKIQAKGMLEMVMDNSGKKYMQLVLGERPSDYLVPLSKQI